VITIPAGLRIYLACGVTDMRRGFDGLSMMAQDVLKQDPFSGAIFCFRGRKGGSDQGSLLGRPGLLPVRQAVPLSRLNGWPMLSPVNASPTPSRAPAHDSGPVWFATPSLRRTCTSYFLPISRRTQRESGPNSEVTCIEICDRPHGN
jgi:transposase